AAVFFLLSLMYLKYRLWKVLTEYKHYFEINNDDGDTYYLTPEEFSSNVVLRWLFRIAQYLFYQWSAIVSFFFLRLCDNVEPQEVQSVRPPPITPKAKRKTKYEPESSVRDFLNSVIQDNML